MELKRTDKVRYGIFKEFGVTIRPWGFFQCFCENEKDITVKVITIRNNEMLSLQRHKNRDQLYYIMDPMEIHYGESEDKLHKIQANSGDTFYFPRGMFHRAINNHNLAEARFFETCWGKNDESDIERKEDKYNRGNG